MLWRLRLAKGFHLRIPLTLDTHSARKPITAGGLAWLDTDSEAVTFGRQRLESHTILPLRAASKEASMADRPSSAIRPLRSGQLAAPAGPALAAHPAHSRNRPGARR